MAKNTVLGIDIGQSRLKLALVSGGSVKKTASVQTPENILKEGRPDPPDIMAELIKNTLKENGIHAKDAALIMSAENAFIQHIDMPVMSTDQLKQNLPYEFNDFIDGNPTDYVFDYIIEGTENETSEDGEETETRMNILGVASPLAYMDMMQEMLKKAGLKFYIAAPELSAYAAVIRHRGKNAEVPSGEYAFIDLGYQRIRIFMYKNDLFMTSRELEWGMSDVVSGIAEELGIDVHTAHSHMEANYENCQYLEGVRGRYDMIAVEIKRSLDFYRFSNPDSALQDIWLIGGGSNIAPLTEEIKASLAEMNVRSAKELFPELSENGQAAMFLRAAGIAMNQ